MNLTVGLDFGTHQTKVCIEDATNPAQKIYEFFEFKNPFGKASVLFPSIVQINEDDTFGLAPYYSDNFHFSFKSSKSFHNLVSARNN